MPLLGGEPKETKKGISKLNNVGETEDLDKGPVRFEACDYRPPEVADDVVHFSSSIHS
jgi:hypothetical protein